MKRAYLTLVLAWLDFKVFLASIHADSAVHTAADAEDEVDRACGWLKVRAGQLQAAQAKQRLALLALQRHDRHEELGIAP